jgi:enoyl-[acyl-carrier-protein] reductase (NADH)
MIPIRCSLPFHTFLNLARKIRPNYYLSNYRQQPLSSSTLSSSTQTKRGLALVLGVANQRSIAWACVESFLQKNYDCIITYHIPFASSNGNVNEDQIHREKYKLKIEKLAFPYMQSQKENSSNTEPPLPPPPRILACIPCNVQTDIPKLCQDLLPHVLSCDHGLQRSIDTIVHSVAYASEMDRPLLQVSSTAYLQAQHISAYSLIELIRECVQHRLLSDTNASVTTLSYLGAVRTVPNYGNMSPAKAALECIVRTLAYELVRRRCLLQN